LAIRTAIPFYFYFKKVNADLIAEKKAEHDALERAMEEAARGEAKN